MSKKCDHTSVGMLVYKHGDLLLIERKLFPFGFAPPAGHVDGDPTFEAAAARELSEEVGLKANKLELVIEGRQDNHCKREDGNWHYWKIYQILADGDLQPSPDETKQAGWFSHDQIEKLAQRTTDYLKGQISDPDWQASPGLEPVWYEWFRALQILH